MKIYNDLNCLVQQIKKLESTKGQLISLKKEFPKAVDDLYKGGNRDQQFIQLKNAVLKSEGDLTKIVDKIDKMINELSLRSQLVESYYAIKI